MRIIALGAILVATSASAQTQTNCYVNGQWINCTSTTQPPLQQTWTNLLPQPRTESPVDSYIAAARAADERKAAAYARVADLIGRGDCEGANRLAAFYGNRQLIEATAKACP